MKILVVAETKVNLGDKYSELWEMLDGAKEAGVQWTKFQFSGDERIEGYDAYIFIDMKVPEYYGAPFVEICSELDDDVEMAKKVQELASYMFGKKEWETPPWYEEPKLSIPEQMEMEDALNHAEEVESEELVIDIVDLGYQITDEEVEKLTIKEFVVNIEGKQVSIPKQDLVALGKVCNLMDKFNYKVKKVIV